MKACKNCGTMNQVHEVKCTTCKMEGHFTLHAAHTEEIIETEHDTVQCTNCASHQTVETARCTQCHFPLTSATTKPIPKLAALLNRKIG